MYETRLTQNQGLPVISQTSRNNSIEPVELTATEFMEKQRKNYSQSLISQRKSEGLEEKVRSTYEYGINSFTNPDPNRPPSYVMPRNNFTPIYATAHTVPSSEELPELVHAPASIVMSYKGSHNSPQKASKSGFGGTVTRRDCFDWKYLPRKKSKQEPAADHALQRPVFRLNLTVAAAESNQSTQLRTGTQQIMNGLASQTVSTGRSVLADRRIVRAMVKQFYKHNQRFGEKGAEAISAVVGEMGVAPGNAVAQGGLLVQVGGIPITNPAGPYGDRRGWIPRGSQEDHEHKTAFNFVGIQREEPRHGSVGNKKPIKPEKLVLNDHIRKTDSKEVDQNSQFGSIPSSPMMKHTEDYQVNIFDRGKSTLNPLGPLAKRIRRHHLQLVDPVQKAVGDMVGKLNRQRIKSEDPNEKSTITTQNSEPRNAKTNEKPSKAKVEFQNRRLDLHKYGRFTSRESDKQTKNLFRELLDHEQIRKNSKSERTKVYEQEDKPQLRPACRISRSRPLLNEFDRSEAVNPAVQPTSRSPKPSSGHQPRLVGHISKKTNPAEYLLRLSQK